MPKPPDGMQVSDISSSSVGISPADNQNEVVVQAPGRRDPVVTKMESSEEAWKEAPRSVTVRGKHHGFAASACNLACENGFDALGILNDLLELQKTRQ